MKVLQTSNQESKAVANISESSAGNMVMGDWKQYIGNGEVINNFSVPVQVWSNDRGVYQIPAGERSEAWGEDVDHVRDGRGNWWKIGWNVAVVDELGNVHNASCRTPTFGVNCPEEEIEDLGGTGGEESTDAGVPLPGGVQPKLEVNQPNDRFEQEADAVAEKVVHGEQSIQRKCSGCEDEELQMKPLVQLKTASRESGSSTSPWIEQQIQNKQGGGRHLPNETRSLMESGIGANFQNVKVHTDKTSVQMNRELGARAFTVGNDIFFNSGQYSPESTEGKKLLAHELTHTVQQGGATENIQRDVVEMEPMRIVGGNIPDRSALAGDMADPTGPTITPDPARVDANSQLANTPLPFTTSGWNSNEILEKLGQYDRIPGTDSDAMRCVQAVGLASHIQMGISATRGYLTAMSLQGSLRGMTPRNRKALDVLDLVRFKIEMQTATYGDLYWAMESMHALFNKDDEGTGLDKLHDVINPAFDLSMTMERRDTWCGSPAEIMREGNSLAGGEQLMLNTWRVSFNIRFEDIPGQENAQRARYIQVREGERDRTVTINRLNIRQGVKPLHTDIDDNRDNKSGHQLLLYKDAADNHVKLHDPELTTSGSHLFDLTADSSVLDGYFVDQPAFELFDYVQVLGKMKPSTLLQSP